MGAYLSEPRTEKISSDEFNDKLIYGASSMQGWRISQEDAHNCIISFDTNTSLFAVYDGHGGHEVAVYCSQKLPDFIKNTETYKKGDLKQALIDAYLGFDATIATKEVVTLLKEIAGSKKNEDDDKNIVDSEDEENVDNLYEEASMPLDKLMEKYHLNTETKKVPVSSANLHSREEPSCSSSSNETCAGMSSSKRALLNEASGSKITLQNVKSSEFEYVENKIEVFTKNNTGSSNTKTENNKISNEINGDKSPSLLPLVENGQISSENTATLESVKDKSNSDDNINDIKNDFESKVLESTEGMDEVKKIDNKMNVNRSKLKHCTIRQLYSAILSAGDCDDADSEDENDITFDGVVDEDSDGDHEDSDEDSVSSGENEKEDDVDDESDEDEEEDDDFTMNMAEEPGWDSGCTAVVALLRGSELYVANAGDSRCVVCRDGKAVEMSIDHKPETKEECDRICAAGGKVTADGRVNGGLNLSRAIGDHAYKQAVGLPAEQQMITALPDVATLTIDPEHDEFMVLACDGIWNYMSSEQVVKFVKEKLKCSSIKISQICEEMFDHCLAPNTMGDGTGCDNMTAIIVHFKNGQIGKAKRSPSPLENENDDRKRIKTDVDVNAAT